MCESLKIFSCLSGRRKGLTNKYIWLPDSSSANLRGGVRHNNVLRLNDSSPSKVEKDLTNQCGRSR